MLRVNKIFYSLEGEGIHVGMPTIFIRLQGCSLQCKWCDTKETWDFGFGAGHVMGVEQIVEEVEKLAEERLVQRISITGGEPLEQVKELLKLLEELVNLDYLINVETNGTVESYEFWQIASRYKNFTVTISPKLSSALGTLWERYVDSIYSNIDALATKGVNLTIKAVVADVYDLEDVRWFLGAFHSYSTKPKFLLQPAWGSDVESEILEFISSLQEFQEVVDFGVSLQVHKLYNWE